MSLLCHPPTSSKKKIMPESVCRGRRISHMTVSSRLSNEFDLKSYKPVKKTWLTAAVKAKHLQLAKNHQRWTAEQLRKALVCDESTFQQFVVQKRHGRKPTRKRFNEKYSQFPASRNRYEWAKVQYVRMLSKKLTLYLQDHN